jgi:hypothetical protein
MKKLYLLAITFVIAGLMITSATSLPVTNDADELQITETVQFCQFVNPVKKGDTPTNMAPLFAGNQITAGDYDEYHPAIAAGASGTLYISFEGSEDGSSYYPIFTYSEDGGTTWADGGYFEESLGATKPDVDFKTSGFYGTFTPPFETSGQIWVVDAATDIANPVGMTWDFGPYSFDSFQDFHISTYTHEGPEGDPGTWNWGGLAFTGFYPDPAREGTPFLFYPYSENGGLLHSYGISDCEHSTIDIDQVTNMSYSVYDRLVTGLYQLYLIKFNFGKWTYNAEGDYWYHSSVTTKTIVGAGNLTYPDVIADSNNVLLVVQSDEAGNQDIVCYSSSNGMSSYTPHVVANGAEDELYPQITWIKPGVAVCVYIKGNEAYYKSTEDYGVTWTAEQRVSDEAITVPEDHAMTIAGMNGNAYAIWQDGRGDNQDIYWDSFYNVEAPNIQIGTVAGGIGKVTMDIVNSGTAEATDVDWSISVKGGLLGRINVTTTSNLASLGAGITQTVQTDKFIFGLGALTIQLTAGSATASKTGRVLLIFVRNIA